jgi:hydroxymethylbilane synthase
MMVPQVAQGALAVECRAGDASLQELLSTIEDAESRWRVDAERSFLAELGGDCDLPAGAHATIGAGALQLDAVLASPDGSRLVRHRGSGADAGVLGRDVARRLRTALESAADPM